MDRAEIDRVFTPAAHAALESFPVDAPVDTGDLTLIAMTENVTFKVTDRRRGGAYVLRLHRPGYHTLEELDSEHAWIRALDEAGVEVPKSIVARDGRNYVPVTIAATGERRFAGMARWTEGRLLSDVLAETGDQQTVEAYFAQLGALVAAMHNQASAWRPPPHFTRQHLDADGLMGDAPHWGPFWEHHSLSAAERRLLLDTRARMHAWLAGLGKEASGYSLIHSDMHPGNILAGGERLAVIDFDDASFGWHQYDIAVVLSYWQSKPNAVAIERAFLDGYRTTRKLPDDAPTWLPMFQLIRGMAAIGWFHQRPELKPPAAFAERRAWVLDQCAALQRRNR